MKRRSVLNKQSVKRHKKKDYFSFFRVIPLVGTGLIKILFVFTGIVMISVCFVFLYNYLVSSPYMKLEEVAMEGVDRETRNELIQTCGLHPDLSLLELNLNDLKVRMEANPWIRSVKLIRKFPHTLSVQAEKETPSAIVLMDKFYYMNRWGEIFKEVREWEKLDFPVVTGISSKKSKGWQEKLEVASLILDALGSEKGLWSLKELSEIHLNKDGSLSLYYQHMAAEIKLRPCDLENKMNGLKRVAEHLRRTGRIHQVTNIDLNHVDGALVSFKNG